MLTAMYGHCDSFDIVYEKVSEGLWQAEVPADLSDGKYVVDIFGIDDTGFIVYWSGILYMYDSRVVRLELLQDSCVIFYDSTDDIQVLDPFEELEILLSPVTILCKGVRTMMCNGVPSIKFVLGEKKYVWFKVVSKVEQTFTITAATWELKRVDEVVASGTCEIDGTDTVRILLEPPAYGAYTLYVSYTIPPEVKKAQVSVLVN